MILMALDIMSGNVAVSVPAAEDAHSVVMNDTIFQKNSSFLFIGGVPKGKLQKGQGYKYLKSNRSQCIRYNNTMVINPVQ